MSNRLVLILLRCLYNINELHRHSRSIDNVRGRENFGNYTIPSCQQKILKGIRSKPINKEPSCFRRFNKEMRDIKTIVHTNLKPTLLGPSSYEVSVHKGLIVSGNLNYPER